MAEWQGEASRHGERWMRACRPVCWRPTDASTRATAAVAHRRIFCVPASSVERGLLPPPLLPHCLLLAASSLAASSPHCCLPRSWPHGGGRSGLASCLPCGQGPPLPHSSREARSADMAPVRRGPASASLFIFLCPPLQSP